MWNGSQQLPYSPGQIGFLYGDSLDYYLQYNYTLQTRFFPYQFGGSNYNLTLVNVNYGILSDQNSIAVNQLFYYNDTVVILIPTVETYNLQNEPSDIFYHISYGFQVFRYVMNDPIDP